MLVVHQDRDSEGEREREIASVCAFVCVCFPVITYKLKQCAEQ